ALVPAPCRNLVELASLIEQLDGRNRCVLEVAVHGNGQDLAALPSGAQPLESTPSCGLESRVTCDRPDDVRVVDPRYGPQGNDLARRVLGDRSKGPGVTQGVHGFEAVRFTDPLEVFKRDVAQHGQRLAANAVIAVGCRD